MLQESVGIKQVDFRDACLSNEIQNVGTCSAHADDADSLSGKFLRDMTDVGTARGSVNVFEYALAVVFGRWQEDLSGRVGIDFGCLTHNASNVGRHLVIVVTVICFGGKGVISSDAFCKVLGSGRIFNRSDFLAISVAGMFACPIGN